MMQRQPSCARVTLFHQPGVTELAKQARAIGILTHRNDFPGGMTIMLSSKRLFQEEAGP
ncbi:hypothetical protein [Bradyrhizobium diazoefficiens]|uniref:hypothetical protein n=2 Tax=Nitrobacteraceae TaxID=41294 RepID=UPI0014960C6F|nr:hypothetical protein [Bradyrhizobium diazoefficiens]MBR0886153.1 hypothetical protein [Bradyrhizobium diazoefficiens]